MALRIGIIGAGQAGARHAMGFAKVQGCDVAAIADTVPERAAGLAGQYGARAWTDWRGMLDAGLDVLVVALPHSMHVEPSEAAASRGVHLLIEKPIATTMADAERIVRACDTAAVKLATGFVHRFRDEAQAARRWIVAGEIGEPRMSVETMVVPRVDLPPWVTSPQLAGGGVLMYTAIHAVDRMLWLNDTHASTVNAQIMVFDPACEVEEGVAAVLTLDNGTAASLVSSAPGYGSQSLGWESQIHGSEGMIHVRGRGHASLSKNNTVQTVEPAAAVARYGDHYPFVRQAADLVDAIRSDRQPASSGADALRALATVLAMYRSAETGATERLG